VFEGGVGFDGSGVRGCRCHYWWGRSKC
jgi:hypothetical protein